MVLCLNECDAELLMAKKNVPHSTSNLVLLVPSLPRRKECIDETHSITHAGSALRESSEMELWWTLAPGPVESRL